MAESRDPLPPAAASSEFPEGFQRPAPLQEVGELSDIAEAEYLRARTVSLAVLRVVAFGAGVPWLIFMMLGRIPEGRYEGTPWLPFADLVSAVWFLLIVEVLGVILAAFIHKRQVYFWTLLTAGGTFVAVLIWHVGAVVFIGESPLSGLYLGDFAGLPVAMLVTVLPSRWAMWVAVISVGSAAAVNLGSPVGFNMGIEIAHSVLLILPFLILLQSARRTSKLLDEMVARAYLTAGRLARTKALKELEVRFLGYLHDRVMSNLDAIRRGVRSPNLRDLPAETFALGALAPSGQLGLNQVLLELRAQITALAPQLEVRGPGMLPESATLPADVSAALSDSTLEAVHNTLSHASGVPAEVAIKVDLDGDTCQGITLMIRDEGPGFNPATIPNGRAGIRVAIAGRMQATDGCSLELKSVPGAGTEVILRWHPDGPVRGDGGADSSDIEVPSAYQMVGMRQVFQPLSAVIAWLVFFSMSLNNQHDHLNVRLLALAAIAVALAMLTCGRKLRLPTQPTVIATVAIGVFYAAAALNFVELGPYWPAAWYPWVFILLCTYLALRDRALVTWILWAAGMGFSEVLVQLGVNDPVLGAVPLAMASLVLIPATLIPRLVKLTTRGLPIAISTRRSELTTMEVISRQRRFLSDTSTWVEIQVRAVLDERFPPEVRKANAHLLELKLRDSIRSPAFTTEAVNRAVWDARATGRQVQILDDRSTQGELPEPDTQLPHLHRQFIGILEERNYRELTLRLFPAGRARYATILLTNTEGEIQRIEVAAVGAVGGSENTG
ncbi:hypothetical protein [Corynebacterium sp. A21]|uniref:hypothetical protein n=1 Tax=Corynebacterium sp. A21 TaxID=3457318 RepID=UPI003FD18AB1